MGFQASEAVEGLSYDFHPYVDAAGEIPEPTSQQIDDFRSSMGAIVSSLPLSAEQLASGKVPLDQLDALLAASKSIEAAATAAVADLTGVPQHLIDRLPYRIKAAFIGYVQGEFGGRPEALTPATS